MTTRKAAAKIVRRDASDLSHDRIPPEPIRPPHKTNGDEQTYGATSHFPMSFTKGLYHDKQTGLVKDTADFIKLRRAIDDGHVSMFECIETPLDPERKWEAPTAGYVFDLEGPDAQAVTMPPAPALGSAELAFEMAEVYELALLRDVSLDEFAAGSKNKRIKDACARMNTMLQTAGATHTRPRIKDQTTQSLTAQELFRGSTRGVDLGPYLSQLMLMGNGEDTLAGLIGYGPQQIDQRVPIAKTNDYLTDWDIWHKAQEGKNLRDNNKLFGKGRRFIQTPRDLATYVHDDALYQAYLNACLILLGHKAPFDPCFDHLSGLGTAEDNNVGGFALWGGPHILTLVTEVATRALKAVRYQKFQSHLRLRPEALAARIEKAEDLDKAYPGLHNGFTKMKAMLPKGVLDDIKKCSNGTLLLPMAFQEGSPMHPSYGAGHAAVAGACVTVLKAFFDTSAILTGGKGNTKPDSIAFRTKSDGNVPVQLEVDPDDDTELKVNKKPPAALTLEGELNKLAANISIGRNMAGVHYFSDYYDSLRMGEEIAIGMLEEQALGYRKDRFVMSLVKFDGTQEYIGNNNDTTTPVFV